MGQMEIEVKVLDINKEEIVNKIEKLGGKFINKYNQYLYTYDLPSIYGRLVDILVVLEEAKSQAKKESEMERLRLLFFEIDNLLEEEDKVVVKNITGEEDFASLLEKENLLEILNKDEVMVFVKKLGVNLKKWIRLRQTNDKTTITVKHILADNGSNIQQMLETEMIVPSMKEADEFLEALGYSHKCYQEKKRISYILNGHQIDIDTWPGLPTYLEIEGDDEKDLKEMLSLLGYKLEDTVSCTVDDIYKDRGIDILNMKELKF